MKIMICEENQDRAKILKDLLNVYKFKLVTLTEGMNIVKEVQTHRPAVIIMNEKFSKKSGDLVLNKLRTNPVGAKTPVIYISENGDTRAAILNSLGDTLLEMVSAPYKIKHLRHYVDRWTLFRSLHIKQ